MSKKITFYVPDSAAEMIEKYKDAQSSMGHTLVALVADAVNKYGYEDYLMMKILGDKKVEGGESDG